MDPSGTYALPAADRPPEAKERTTLRLRERDLEWREIDGDIVVLDVQDAEYLAARGSAALVWRLLSESTTREALIDALIESYGIDRPHAKRDIEAFLGELSERGWLLA